MTEKSADDREAEMIMEMSERELLVYILDNPFYLTDFYYSKFGNAIEERARQLIGANQ